MPHDAVAAPSVRCSNERRTGADDRGDHDMPKYVIERTVPGAGQMDAAALGAIAAKSNEVLRDLGPDIQWVHSYVSDDKIICVYYAANEELIREHGRCGGFPVDTVAAGPDDHRARRPPSSSRSRVRRLARSSFDTRK